MGVTAGRIDPRLVFPRASPEPRSFCAVARLTPHSHWLRRTLMCWSSCTSDLHWVARVLSVCTAQCPLFQDQERSVLKYFELAHFKLHTRTHTCIHTRTHAHTRKHKHHTQAHTRTQTQTQTHTHTIFVCFSKGACRAVGRCTSPWTLRRHLRVMTSDSRAIRGFHVGDGVMFF